MFLFCIPPSLPSANPPPFRQGRRQKFICLYADKLKFTGVQTCKAAERSLCHMFVNAEFVAKPKASSNTLLRLRLTKALFCNSPAAAAETGGQSVHDPSDRCQYRRQHVYNSDPHKAQPLMCSRWAIDLSLIHI